MGKLFQFKRQTAAEAGNCRRCCPPEANGERERAVAGKKKMERDNRQVDDDSQEKCIKLSGKLCNAYHTHIYLA